VSRYQLRPRQRQRTMSAKPKQLTEIELFPLTSRLPTYDVASIPDDKFGLPKLAKPGNSIKQGHHIAISTAWLTSVDGLESVQLYLWLIKDWSWCMLHWVYPGIVCGTAAVILSVILLFLSLGTGLYSEAYVATAMLLWLGANYLWMLGEFINENWLDDPEEVFYLDCLEIAKVFAMAATSMLALYFFLLMPVGFFEQERRNNPLMVRLLDDSPTPRFKYLFPTFRDYETIHLLFWAVKDTCWIFNWKYAYALGFVPTLLLNVDLTYLYATHKNQFGEMIHSIILGLWVLSNGVWAYGEMIAETPPEGVSDDELIPEEDWDTFDWPWLPLSNTAFRHRYAAGWIFVLTLVIVVVYYIHWILISIYRPPIEQAEDYEPKSVSTMEREGAWSVDTTGDHHVVAI